MVRIAFAGGSGNVAQEIIDVLVATKKHEIVLLSRKDAPPAGPSTDGVTWIKVSYDDTNMLEQALTGVHTVLSFINDGPGQKRLIDAAVHAGVTRFAPSEWCTSSFDHLFWYAAKGETREYLKELNKNYKVIEYTLFQPGLFLNYFTAPYKSSNHIHVLETPIDFNKRRALVVDGGEDARITLTTVHDLAQVVARAIDFQGQWPVVSGIRGGEMSIKEIIALGEKLRGGPFTVERFSTEDLKKGTWESSWVPRNDHPAIPADMVDALAKPLNAGILLGIASQAYLCSNEWNTLLPDYHFTQPEEFLSEFWQGKP
ncbi:hypothetical protein BX600DRAFT_504432 [Xylariales sp. PMI_506]|nr:hypothetical protein BX600DRAFT_504432 [Xylariales sp. PMI_506]